jgi:hypothetical protein
MNNGLRITLYAIAVWEFIFGALFLFAPSLAEKMVSASLPDKNLTMLYGQGVLTFSYLAFLAARGGEQVGKLSRIALVLVAGHVLVFGYQLITGMATFMQVGPPLIVNVIFTVLLLIFRRNIKG